jgi:hypothetical protein
MDTETLNKGQKITRKIQDLQDDINTLERGVNIVLLSAARGGRSARLDCVSQSVRDTCKLLIEADLKSQLEAAEKEFAEL